MKISAVPSAVTPTLDGSTNQPSRVDSLRLRMTTNANPTQIAQELPISAHNETETVAATQPLSPQLALLAKQRRALQQERRALEDQKKALLSQSTGSTAIDVARLKSEPLSVLLENGITYDQLTEAIMAGQGNSEMNALKAEIESLKQGIDQKFLDKDTAAEKQVLAEMRREADQLVKGDEYELTREMNGVPQAMTLIERTYKETGEILDVSEALRLVEEELFKDAQKIARFKKMQSQMYPPQVQPQRQYGMRTLTNRDTASVPMSARARALAAFNGTLKR